MYRTITPEETEKLFNLCEKYGVFFYDVQIELVDHLASLLKNNGKKIRKSVFNKA
jgi:hypothetical protein